MKLTKIYLKDFHQFKDLTIDLTYPKGHEKEGKPLDKVCFIGQSGTGKTSLLELMLLFLYAYEMPLVFKNKGNSFWDLINESFISIAFGAGNEYECKVTWEYGLEHYNYTINKEKADYLENNKFLEIERIKEIETKLIYFPSNLDYNIDDDDDEKIEAHEIIDFSKKKVSALWNFVLRQIKAYHQSELFQRQLVSIRVEQALQDLDVIRKALQEFENWKKTAFNPIKDIADNCLNNLLAPFKVKVKEEFNFQKKEDIGFIKIENFIGEEVPYGLWSTGTKQVILSAIPLYLLKPKHTVILFDEPERSLYPDLQRFIIDFYSSLTEDCQFFYSTHSPIIASNFEPWEIVELKFNEEGNVYRELYYEGENHVDNYKYNPRYMRWDDILQRIFDMENDGSPLRKQKLDELATYNVKYKKLEKQKKADTEEGSGILSNIQRLSKELSAWEN